MLHVIKQTRAEKIKMYMGVPKRKICEMLCNCNELLYDNRKGQVPYSVDIYTPPSGIWVAAPRRVGRDKPDVLESNGPRTRMREVSVLL